MPKICQAILSYDGTLYMTICFFAVFCLFTVHCWVDDPKQYPFKIFFVMC